MKCSIGHLAYRVADIDKTLEFYRDKMGFPVMFQLGTPDSPQSTVYVRIAPGQFLEFFVNPENQIGKHADNSFVHLCLHVDDIEASRNELVEKGVEVTPVKLGKSKSWICFLSDPDGNEIELMQRTEQSLQTIHDHD